MTEVTDELLEGLSYQASNALGDLADLVGVELCVRNWCDLNIVLMLDEPWSNDKYEAYWGAQTHPDFPYQFSGPLMADPVYKNGYSSLLLDNQDGSDPAWYVFKDSNKVIENET